MKPILVLGSDINADGSLSPEAQATVELVASLYRQQPCRLIFSGGHSYEASVVPLLSEAQAMKDAAVALGVASGDILVETESKDTIGNIYFTKVNLLEPLGITEMRVLGTFRHAQARLDFILHKVLGPDYTYEYVVRPSGWPADSEHERTSLERAALWFKDIADGDDDAIYTALRTTHPGYNGSRAAAL